ncbi:MAG: 4-hydroxybenzoate octaprenyltransferase, partial [Pseudomonadota bacterium]
IMGLFIVGAFVMRGAGCVINDILDRDFDAQVARTQTRPIPSGQVSVRQAILFLAALMTVGLIILLSFNALTIALGVFSVLLIAVYPLMKRVTWWPQVFLGLTFNWGALMGWTAVSGRLDPAPIVLYVAALFWTVGYDTIYAHQDKDDDALIGVKSSALALGDKTHRWVTVFYTLSIGLMALAGRLAGLTMVYWICLIPVALHLAWQVRALRIEDPTLCLKIFKANRDTGLLIFAAVLISQILPHFLPA